MPKTHTHKHITVAVHSLTLSHLTKNKRKCLWDSIMAKELHIHSQHQLSSTQLRSDLYVFLGFIQSDIRCGASLTVTLFVNIVFDYRAFLTTDRYHSLCRYLFLSLSLLISFCLCVFLFQFLQRLSFSTSLNFNPSQFGIYTFYEPIKSYGSIKCFLCVCAWVCLFLFDLLLP